MISLLHNLLSLLPLKFRSLLGRGLGRLFALYPSRERRIAEIQMQKCLGSLFKKEYVPKVFSNLGETVLECMNLSPILENIDSYVACDTWQIAEDVKTQGKSVIVLTAHTANWDLLAAYAIKKGFTVSTIAREARNPKLQTLLSKIRSSYGINTIWRDSPSSTRDIIRSLRSEGVLAALIDQDVEAESIHVPFFDIPAKYPAGLVNLGKKSKASIIAAFIFRESLLKYRIYLHKLDENQSAAEILSAYSSLLEDYIRKYPSQWVWFHKRWRSLEDGKRLSGKEYLNYLSNYEFKELPKAS